MHDLIIVGAGTAGCVLAERLSVSGKLRVLLVEAGGEPKSSSISIPAGFANLFKTKFDWALESQPQKSIGGRRIFTPRGRMLGGSANMNAQIHQWCHPADFDGWGVPGWNWSDVVPVFQAQECWLGENGGPHRGRSGPMFISPNANARPLSRSFVTAARRTGLGDQKHYNGDSYTGAWIAEIAHHRGKRFSAYDAYLKPALARTNLQVIRHSHATRILFDQGIAQGVRLLDESGGERTFPSRAVVLAAGAFGSPHLLAMSGVGPSESLRRLAIDIVHDAPDVGANLQDHPILPLVFRSATKDTFKRATSPINLLRYLLLKRGMLASCGAEAFAFAQVHKGDVEAPDLELLFLPFDVRPDLLEPPREHAFSIGAAVVKPRSRGRLIFTSPDPLEPPEIDFGLLTDVEDIDKSILLEGVRIARRIANSSPLREQNAGEMRPGSEIDAEMSSLEQLTTDVQTVYHPTSTCRMGSDDRAVVDPRLSVNGVQRLWVADASVMPSVPRGHPNAAVAMIAARAAGWIEESLHDRQG